MKKSRQKLINEYVDLRCRKIQEQWYNPGSWDWNAIGDTTANIGKGLGKMAFNLSGPGAAYNVIDRGMGAYNDITSGESVKDVAGNVANMYLDDTQNALDVLGMIPAAGIIPDAANVAISGGRAAVAGDKKTKDKHLSNLALSSLAAIPGAGLAAGAGKIGKNMAKLGKTGQTIAHAGKIIKPLAKTVKVPGKATKVVVKKSKDAAPFVQAADNTTTPINQPKVVTAGGGGSGPFSSLYKTLRDPIANAFDFSKSTTMNYQ